MKKNYVVPQVVRLEVAVEGEVFAGSLNSFGPSTGVNTGNLGTGSSTSNSSISLRERLTPSQEPESNEIYDELIQ